MARLQIKGLKEAEAKLKQLEDSMGAQNLRNVLYEAIDLIRAEAIKNAQAVIASHAGIYPHRKLTGELVASIQSFKGRSRQVARAFTKAKYGKGALSSEKRARLGLAPHAHLVEYGHRISRKRLARVKKVSQRLAGLKVGSGFAPAHPFFKPAIVAMRKQMRDLVQKGCSRLVNAALHKQVRAAEAAAYGGSVDRGGA